ncbi:hypothetical protein HV819_00325 [Anaerococcus sp. AGMB00486]|uniref:Uncharacterized protein n=1 Tax=Anaerococcus faecalis TaxID=2742993 RepID=A0ABX2N702_9FIRM|nr:hypothetical protein [Anaerococcus faecalis]NVF10464.1 hypothetical protein [Anaerococcus faecalis]
MSIDYFITNLLNIKVDNISFLGDIHHEFIKGVKRHLMYFNDKIYLKMHVSINIYFEYLDFIENSFIYKYPNDSIEGINNFIKLLSIFILDHLLILGLEFL